jgi:hypothetical protein
VRCLSIAVALVDEISAVENGCEGSKCARGTAQWCLGTSMSSASFVERMDGGVTNDRLDFADCSLV